MRRRCPRRWRPSPPSTTAGPSGWRSWWTPASRPPSWAPPSGIGWSPTAASTNPPPASPERGGGVPTGRVDTRAAVITGAGQRIGAGDRIATRRNDRDLGVANRDSWTVTAVGPQSELVVHPADANPGRVTPSGPATSGVTPGAVGERVLPVDYVTSHVELAY